MTEKPLIRINTLNVEFPLGRTLFGKPPMLQGFIVVALEIRPGLFFGRVV